jgi:hypothetical protein
MAHQADGRKPPVVFRTKGARAGKGVGVAMSGPFALRLPPNAIGRAGVSDVLEDSLPAETPRTDHARRAVDVNRPVTSRVRACCDVSCAVANRYRGIDIPRSPLSRFAAIQRTSMPLGCRQAVHGLCGADSSRRMNSAQVSGCPGKESSSVSSSQPACFVMRGRSSSSHDHAGGRSTGG